MIRINNIINFLKVTFGKTVIGLIYYPWWTVEKMLGISFGANSKSHYYYNDVLQVIF